MEERRVKKKGKKTIGGSEKEAGKYKSNKPRITRFPTCSVRHAHKDLFLFAYASKVYKVRQRYDDVCNFFYICISCTLTFFKDPY